MGAGASLPGHGDDSGHGGTPAPPPAAGAGAGTPPAAGGRTSSSSAVSSKPGTPRGLKGLLKRYSRGSDRRSAESTCSSAAAGGPARNQSLDSAHLRMSTSGGTLSSYAANHSRASQEDTPPASQHAGMHNEQQLPPRASGKPTSSGGGSAGAGGAAASPQPSLASSVSGRLARVGSGALDSLPSPGPAGRASFALDAAAVVLERPPTGRLSASAGAPPLPPAHPNPAASGAGASNSQRLSSMLLQQHTGRSSSASATAGGGGGGHAGAAGAAAARARASIDSVGSRASRASSGAARSGRSSFAAEAVPAEEEPEVDSFGRPSFAAFEAAALQGRGAVFEASLPPDLADMYRRLAVLLPQAPVPLVTLLQLWGISDPQEAQETVQIFVMQGVLKVATLPDGASWVMASPEHQQFVKAAHPDSLPEWHKAVLELYRRQVIAARHKQQQQLLAAGDPAGAVMLSDEVAPSEFVNDGYIWLALTHHLMGAGRLEQVRALLLDPAWLEVKLHCYGVAVVVDDFRNYLQAGNDTLVKVVLQAFQMSLSSCMERSQIPMMRSQIVLRLMAAARAAAMAPAGPGGDAAAGDEGDGPVLPGRSASSDNFLAAALGLPPPGGAGSGQAAVTGRGSMSGPPGGGRLSITSAGSGTGSAASFKRQQAEYAAEMPPWYARQFAASAAASGLLVPRALLLQLQALQQQPLLPPHLLAYTPSLNQAGGRNRMALRGHTGAIRQVVIAPGGKDVLTASDDSSVQVWDMDIGDCVMQLRLPDHVAPHPLTCLAVTPDGSCCLCGDAEGWLSCWNLKTGALLQRLRAHNGRVNALAMDLSGSRCLTAGQDRAARMWSLPAAGLSAAGTFDAVVGSVALEMELAAPSQQGSGTGAVLAVCMSNDGVLGASAGDDFTIRVWDLDHRVCLKTCKGHSGWVVAIKFLGDSHTVVSASHDGTARVWDAWTGDWIATLQGHTGRLNAVVASRDGGLIVTCSDDNTARVWHGSTYKLVSVLVGHTSWVADAALSHNGSRAVTASGDGTARLWDARSGTFLQLMQGHGDELTCVVLTSRARFAVTGSVDGTAQVWDTAAESVADRQAHDGKVIGIVARSDGSRAASIASDGVLRLWDIATGKCLSNKVGHTTATPQQLKLLPDGSLAFSASGARKLIRWDMATGSPTLCLQQKQGSRTKCVDVSADGRTAVVLLYDSSMAVYDIESGALRCDLMRKGERDAQRVHSGGVNGVLLTADGSTAVSWSKDATARVWDTATGACTMVLQGHQDSITTAVLSPDEQLLATASFDGTARIWALGPSSGGACLKVLQHTEAVSIVAFSAALSTQLAAAAAGASSSAAAGSPQQQQRLVTACEGHALWLWDVHSGVCIAALGEHKDRVTGVAFSPDGAWLASVSQDRSALLWEAATGQLSGLYVGDAAMACCHFAWRGPPPQRVRPHMAGGRLQLPQHHQQQPPQDAGGAATERHVGVAPGGLTLLAGDTTGHVHFISCW